jgi:predicted NAD-dependent protein-ADP-ribosyltransferase YbiA (DUF1768 family)
MRFGAKKDLDWIRTIIAVPNPIAVMILKTVDREIFEGVAGAMTPSMARALGRPNMKW